MHSHAQYRTQAYAHTYARLFSCEHTRISRSRQVVRVEIVNPKGHMVRVYFWVPEFCFFLTPASKDSLLWSVERRTPALKLLDFYSAIPRLHADMRHHSNLHAFSMWRWMMRHRAVAIDSQFYLAIAQNLCLVVNNSVIISWVEQKDTIVADIIEGARHTISRVYSHVSSARTHLLTHSHLRCLRTTTTLAVALTASISDRWLPLATLGYRCTLQPAAAVS